MRYFLVTILFSFSFLGLSQQGGAINVSNLTGLAAFEKDCGHAKSGEDHPFVKGCSEAACDEDTKTAIINKCKAVINLRENGNFGELPFVPLTATSIVSSESTTGQTASAQGQTSTMGCVGSEYAADYKRCKNVVSEMNTMSLAEQAMTFQHQQKLTKTQTELSNRVSKSSGDTQVAIQAQIDELSVRINQNNNMGYLYSAKAVELGRQIARWPTSKNIDKNLEGCSDLDDKCEAFVATFKRELTPNEGFRTALASSIQQIALKGAEIIAAGNLMKDQKKQLEAQLGIVAEVSEGGSEFLTTYCQSDEGRADTEKCGIYGVNPNYNTAGLANFGDDQEWSVANIGDSSVQGITSDLDPNNPATGEGQESIRDGLLDFENEKSSGAFIDNPTAASIGEGAGGAGGGGAGGGGAGGGGAGPGLSTKPNQPGEKELASLTKVKSDAAYAKTKGSFYKKATRAKNNRRSDDDSGAKKGLGELGIFGRSPAEDAPVGPQNIALFDLISDRYEKVKEQGRVKK